MIKNYFKIAYRSLLRNKGYAAINILGLAVGMAVCLLIGLYVSHAFSYDQFHEEAERIYRVTSSRTIGDRADVSPYMSAFMGPTLVADIPGVKGMVRFDKKDEALISRPSAGERVTFYEEGFLFADSTFFDVFSFDLLRGNPATALDQPYSVILTKSMAEKYFGSENPIGQPLTYNNEITFTVTGVVADPPSNSSIQFNFLASLATLSWSAEGGLATVWGGGSHPTFVLLAPGVPPEAVERKIPEVLASHTSSPFTIEAEYWLTSLTDLHFYAEGNALGPSGDIRYVYIFLSVAILILLVASINYMNLATARSAGRAREVGVRKVAGANRWQLARQFLGESVLLTLAALLLALVLTGLALPLFNAALQIDLGIGTLLETPFILGIFGAVLLIGVLSGMYPALVLSHFEPTEVLKGRGLTMRGNSLLRKGLVVFQFVISVALIAGTLVIQRQLDYVRTTQLGLDEEHVLVIPLKNSSISEGGAEVFKRELLTQPGVVGATVSSSVPTRGGITVGIRAEGVEGYVEVAFREVDRDFLETLDIDLEVEQGFSGTSRSVLLNEAAVRRLGWTDPVGKRVRFGVAWHSVAGVVENYHFESLREEIKPLVLAVQEQPPARYVSVEIQPGSLPAVIGRIGASWAQLAPGYPFDYFFLDAAFDELYQSSDRLARIFSTFTLLAVMIACMGLFGLAAYTTEQRTKEIGVRKVLGASAASIVMLLSKDYLKLIGLAYILAVPVAYLAMRRWLQDFAYHVEIGVGVFLLAGVLTLLIALATVSYQSIKAAWANPVDALRSE